MTKNNRFNQQDLLSKDKIEASSYLIYSEKYRKGLSPVAVLMYQYIMKRYSVSEMKYLLAMEENTLEDFTFIDDEDNVFCYVSNDELSFVLNISEPTVIKCKKELKAVGLLEEVKQTTFKSNRLYLNKVEADPIEKSKFDTQLKEHRNKKAIARKAKNVKRDHSKKEVQITQLESPETSEKPVVTVGRVVNLKNLSSVNLKILSSVNLKILRQSTKEYKSTKEYVSTKESFKTLKHEEEEYIYTLRSENIIYDYIYEFLTEKGISEDTIFKTLRECKDKGLELATIENIQEQFKYMMGKIASGESIGKFESLFVKGVKDKVEQTIANQQYQQEQLSAKTNDNVKQVPFYNWLEERD